LRKRAALLSGKKIRAHPEVSELTIISARYFIAFSVPENCKLSGKMDENSRVRIRPRGASLLLRYVVIVVIAGASASLFAYVGGWFPRAMYGGQPHARQIVDAFEATSVPHSGFRRNHAKGICVTGHFESNGNASVLSKASVFERGTYPIIGRFSAPGTNPERPDADSRVRSFALQFALPRHEQWRTGMNSTPIFAVRTPKAVFEQLSAQALDASGHKDPVKMTAFLHAHPEAQAFDAWIDSHPPSSAFFNASYYGINAFRFVDDRGGTRYVRWRVVPDTPYQPVGADMQGDPDFLEHELVERLEQGPLRWHLMIAVAQAGDPTDDATRQWPAERDRDSIDAGTLVIDHAQSQIDGPCRDISFDPLVLPQGIEASNDPLLAARSSTYAVSFYRRASEEARYGATKK
jgi:catalase